jgi:hypothetical protein
MVAATAHGCAETAGLIGRSDLFLQGRARVMPVNGHSELEKRPEPVKERSKGTAGHKNISRTSQRTVISEYRHFGA